MRIIRQFIRHFAEAHGANLDSAGTDDTGNFGVHKGRVATLILRTGDCTEARTVVEEELLSGIPALDCYRSATGNIAVDKDSAVLRQSFKLGLDILAARDHLGRVIRGDVGREEFG